jgi:Flp pilus assembly protein TadD
MGLIFQSPGPAVGAEANRSSGSPIVTDTLRTAGFGIAGLTPIEYARSQPAVILHYLRLAVWPDRLCFDYAWQVSHDTIEIVLTSALLLALLLATLWAWRRSPPLGFLGAWFFLILAPTSSIMPIQDLAVEHRMYLPLASVVVLGILGGYCLCGIRVGNHSLSTLLTTPVRGTLLALVVLELGLLTYARNADYQSTLGMWADVVFQRPHNARGHNNLGKALLEEGNINEAIRAFRQAIHIAPNYDTSYANLGLALLKHGDRQAAIVEYEKSLLINPRNQRAHNDLGALLMEHGHLKQAAEHLRTAMSLSPNDPLPPLNLGMTLQLQGEWQEAADAYRRVIALKPEEVDAHCGLAFVLYRLGKTEEGHREYELSLRLAPSWPQTHLQTAWELATNPDPRRRIGTVAVQFATQVVEATEQTDPRALDVLAAAYAEMGRFGEAVPTARRAAELADAKGRPDLAAAIRDRLRGYENHKPFRIVVPSSGNQRTAQLSQP